MSSQRTTPIVRRSPASAAAVPGCRVSSMANAIVNRERRRRARSPPLQPELLAEDLLHHLVRAASDRPEASVAQRPLDTVLAHVAVAAEDLHDVVGDLDAGPLGEELGLGHVRDDILTG